MAGLNSAVRSPQPQGQFAAIAWLRWRIFVNSLRTVRGRLEMVSWILMGLGFAFFGLGGAFGLGAAAWFTVSRGTVEWLAAPLWGVFLYWQLFPVMATAFSENFDASNFLRFPLGYRPYFLLRVVYGTPSEKLAAIPGWIREIVEREPRARFERCHLKQCGEAALIFETIYWVTNPDYATHMDVQQEINLAIYRTFQEQGVEFAHAMQATEMGGRPPARS